jgi:protein gp37
MWPARLDQPLRWRAAKKVFVCSTGDLFHADVPADMIAKVWAVMALAPRHTFQVLTKRPARMRSLLRSPEFYDRVCRQLRCEELDERRPSGSAWANALARFDPSKRCVRIPEPLPNLWLGVSAENQDCANRRIPLLLDVAASTRFVSAEPLLGPVDLRQALSRWSPPIDHPAWEKDQLHTGAVLHWLIVGGESGRWARPMHPDWARGLRDQCMKAGVAFHFKQWGEYQPESHGASTGGYWLIDRIGNSWTRIPAIAPTGAEMMRRVGKHRAGRMLDGRAWDEYPVSAAETVPAAGTTRVKTFTPVTGQEAQR